MPLQLLFFQVVIVIVLSTKVSSKNIPKIEDMPKLKVKDLQSGIRNVGDFIEATRSSLNSEEKVSQTTQTKRYISQDLHRGLQTNIKTLTSKTKRDCTGNLVVVPNKRQYLDPSATYTSHDYTDSSITLFDKDTHKFSQELRYDYYPAGDPSYNLEGSEIVDAAFIVPEGYDQPLPAPAAPATSYNLLVNDGTTTRNEFRKDNGEFALSYSTADGTTRSERGTLVRGSSGQTVLVLSGSYSYVGSDGRRFRVDYTADERGYRAVTVPEYYQHGNYYSG